MEGDQARPVRRRQLRLDIPAYNPLTMQQCLDALRQPLSPTRYPTAAQLASSLRNWSTFRIQHLLMYQVHHLAHGTSRHYHPHQHHRLLETVALSPAGNSTKVKRGQNEQGQPRHHGNQ
jgi:hypothetical protein